MEYKSQKSIKSILVKGFALGVGVAFTLIFLVTFIIVQKDIKNIKEESISRMVSDGADTITAKIDVMFATAYTVAADPVVSDPNLTLDEKKDTIATFSKERDISSIGYISEDGYLTGSDGFENDISQKQYCKDLLAGNLYISYPQINTVTNSQIIFIGVPRYYNDNIVGALTCCFDSSVLSDLISGLKYMGEGKAYMISDTGLTIASYDTDAVLNNYNILEAAKEDSSLSEEAEITQYMIDNESGIQEFGDNLLFFDKVQDGADWTVVFELPKSVLYKEIYSLVVLFVVFALIGIGLVVGISYYIGSKIGNKLIILSNHLEQIANGDFTVQIEDEEKSGQDEIGQIYRSLDRTVNDIGNTLNTMKDATNNLVNQMNILNDTSDVLETGSKQVANSVSDISEGNTKQATEIDTINSEMEKFGENVEKVNHDIGNVVTITSSANDKLTEGNREMVNLQGSFEQFNKNFNEFRQIINNMNESLNSINLINSTISEIAEQTNLLSLNASIEAARAGEAGKGFGVVAQEISKLAEECGNSVSEISEVVGAIMTSGKQLIDSTSEMDVQMQQQDEIITSTIASFDELARQMLEISPQIKNVYTISNDNLQACQVIEQSIQNVKDISEEVLNITASVNQTSDSFLNTSGTLIEATKRLQELSETLDSLTEKFRV